ncbi:MAG: tyrosine-type recombinase/integrase [Bacteroidia bacterium]
MKRLTIHSAAYLDMLKSFEEVIVAQSFSGGKNGMPVRVREFLFFLETKKIYDINRIQTSDIIAFYEYLRKRPNMVHGGLLSNTQVQCIIYSAQYFLEHLVQKGIIEKMPCALPRFTRKQAEHHIALTEEEIKLLYGAARSSLDKALLACAWGCGMRRGELSKLKISEVNFNEKVMSVRSGKNNKSRSIPIAEGLIKDLKEYLTVERPKREKPGKLSPYFFLGREGTYMVPDRFNTRFKELVKLTGDRKLIAKRPSIHSLRASISVHLVDRGAPALFVKNFLGHVNLDTSFGIYAARRRHRVKLSQWFQKH